MNSGSENFGTLYGDLVILAVLDIYMYIFVGILQSTLLSSAEFCTVTKKNETCSLHRIKKLM